MQPRFTFLLLLLSAFVFSAQAQNTFPSTGNVGIGTTAPQQRLHVEGSGNQAIFVSTTAPSTTSGSGMIGYLKALPTATGHRLGYFLFGSRGGANNNYNAAGMIGYAGGAWTSTSRPAYLTFETTPSGSAAREERMRIDTNGYVGIGTISPAYSLDVRHATSQNVINAKSTYSGYGDRIGIYAESINSTGYGYGVQSRGGWIGVYATANVGGYAGVYSVGSGRSVGVSAYSVDSYGLYASTGNSSSHAGSFQGSVYSSGNYVGSDHKLKQKIDEISSAMAVISKLQPRTYEYRQDGNFGLMNLPKGKRYGLIAQEVEEVLPGLVKETEFNPEMARPGAPAAGGNRERGETIHFKAVNYAELVPVVIKALQEQQQQIEKQQQVIEKQQEQIEELKQLVSKLANGQNLNTSLSSGALLQNAPNPVVGTTSIQYSLPEGSSRGQLLLTDALGRTLKAIQLTSSGVVNVDVSSLSSGVYNYSLVVDGKTVQTRKMTVER